MAISDNPTPDEVDPILGGLIESGDAPDDKQRSMIEAYAEAHPEEVGERADRIRMVLDKNKVLTIEEIFLKDYPNDRLPHEDEYGNDFRDYNDFKKFGPIFGANWLARKVKNANGYITPSRLNQVLMQVFGDGNMEGQVAKHLNSIAFNAYTNNR